MPATLLRQWHMLRLIPRYPRKITVSELRKKLAESGFDTSDRTLQRDLVTLSTDGFALAVDDRNRPHGWHWAKDASIVDIPGMDVHAALSMQLAEQFIKPMMPPATISALTPYFQQAARVLNSSPSPMKDWLSKVRIITRGQRLLPPDSDSDALLTVYQALFEERQLKALYLRRKDHQIREYVINPLGLVFRDSVIYLICTLFDYEDVVQLAVHRITQPEIQEAPSKRPEKFDLDEYLREGSLDFRLGDELNLEIELREKTAFHLLETPLSPDQYIGSTTDDGWVPISATVPDTAQIRWWLLGLGADVRVKSPRVLRDEMISSLQESLANYEAGSER